MKRRQAVLFLLMVNVIGFTTVCPGQNWNGIINPTRAVNWQRANVGVAGGVPSDSWTQCGSTIGAYNGSSATINNALSSCPANHYVLLGPGTFTLSGGILVNGLNNVVLRGSGPNSTTLLFTSSGGCYSLSNICLTAPAPYIGSATGNLVPPCGGSGATQCANWTGGYSQGGTSITVKNVGSAGIHNGDQIVLDQAQDQTDTGGYMICFLFPTCNTESAQSSGGRLIAGQLYLQEQYVTVTAGCNSACTGNGPFTLTIFPGLYENNWNQGAGAGNVGVFFTFPATHLGVENLTVSGDSNTDSVRYNIGVYNCVQCWVKNVASIKGTRAHIQVVQSPRTEVRDSYFYGTAHGGNQSYGLEMGEPAGDDSLIENNIFQQIASPVVGGGGMGWVVAYNFAINDVYSPSSYLQGPYVSHDAHDSFQLWEGNIFPDVISDDIHGTSGAIDTFFRNWLNGYDWNQGGHPVNQTFPFDFDSFSRGMNVIGNVLGTPGYHTQYENYTGHTVTNCNNSIYVLGWSNGGVNCTQGGTTPNDPLVRSSLMRWGNYDVVNNAVRWDSTESSPGAVTYIAAQSTPTNQTLPPSFYLPSQPAWWGTIPFPAIGPDVSGGNGGFFTSGTYAKGSCPVGFAAGGATCSSAVGGHANVSPAMSCYYSVLNGAPDGTGNPLPFDANACYGNNPPPAPPQDLNAVVQ